MKTHKKASPGNGKNNKVKNSRKQSGHSGRFAKSLLLTEGLLIVLAVMVLMGIRLWQKSNPASAASAMLQDKPDGLNLVHASDSSARSAKAAQKNSKDSSGDTPKGLQPEAFAPHCTESTAPSNYIQTTEINIDGTTLTDPLSYKPDQAISFGKGSEYTDVDGIVTFRGNNFRDNPVYGTADMKKNKLTSLWSAKTSSITYNGATWSGSGWTGQPLIMKWPKKVKKAMNMYDWAKEKDDLVEVIYACMDGYVYFLDLETGEATRDTLNLGFTFKGSGALDPRGYPILYVGAGYDSNQGTARVFVVNLLDCSVMYTFGNNDPFSLRGALSYFDSSPLVDADTDTLIYPGENGILYLIRLNTQYDQESGTLSINPNHIVKWHYYGNRTSVASYWLGMEDSAAVYGGYLFVTDNGGNLMCLNLNTLQLVWAQDTLDDSNSTPVLSIEDDHLYLYVSTSFRLGWRSSSSAEVPIWKIDAKNGHIIWKTSYECYSDDGVLACLDKKTGEVKWEHKAYYAWSSPVCVYNSDGSGKVLYCSCGGKAYLLDGNSGKLLDENEISSGAIEASPAIYNDYMVVGTRDCRICGLKLE